MYTTETFRDAVIKAVEGIGDGGETVVITSIDDYQAEIVVIPRHEYKNPKFGYRLMYEFDGESTRRYTGRYCHTEDGFPISCVGSKIGGRIRAALTEAAG